MTEDSERLTAMEVRYSHQARLLDELNDELTAANLRIDELAREVRSLREMLGSLAPQMEESPDE